MQFSILLITKFSSPAWTLFWHSVYCIPVVSADRCQSTSVDTSSFSPSQLMYGVPQGSILGPVLFVLHSPPLSGPIANRYVNHQLFADDTHFPKSAPLSEVTNLTKELNACTDGVKHGGTKISLNLTTTRQKLFFSSSSSLKPSTISIPGSITLGSHNIAFSESARNLGFILDSKQSMKKNVTKNPSNCLLPS